MISVIIAGGSGTRLWPLSTPDHPKHLLKITSDKSLLQNTYNRAKSLGDAIYVVSEKSHAHLVKEQLPALPANHLIIEPARRGTASCFVAALCLIRQQHQPDEPIVFMHADHHIRDQVGFTETIQLAEKVASQQSKIILLGVEPNYPATGFGYIQRGKHINGGTVFAVASFKEKPDRNTAQKYLDTGDYLWNMGYFVGTIGLFEERLQQHAPELWKYYEEMRGAKDQAELEDIYKSADTESIDVALIERDPDLLVIPGQFDWMDVGSFSDMHVVHSHDDTGNTVQGKVAVEKVSNSLVLNDTETPISVIGLDNVAVVATKHGILVTNKNYSQLVGEVSKRHG